MKKRESEQGKDGSIHANNTKKKSDRIESRGNPVTALRSVPGGHCYFYTVPNPITAFRFRLPSCGIRTLVVKG